MIRWLCNTIFKDYIDELVDHRFKENMYERYKADQTRELRERSNAVRKTLYTSAHGTGIQAQGRTVLSNSLSKVSRQAEPNLQVSPSQSLKDKLKGIKR